MLGFVVTPRWDEAVNDTRNMLFVSHANPEDNEVARWLALRLAREGYPVWCDLTKLLGGERFWDDIEAAIRERTVKFLFVLSRASNTKPGPLNELELASKVQRQHKLRDFIIPLRADDLPAMQFNIRLTSINAIMFYPGWARGLDQLLKKLEEDGVPKAPAFGPDTVTTWWREHMSAAGGLRSEVELLTTNWYPIEPTTLYFHELKREGFGALEVPTELPYPAVPYNQYLVSFAAASAFEGRLGPLVSITTSVTRMLGAADLLGTPQLWSNHSEERQTIGTLLRYAWLAVLRERNLPIRELANHAVALYFTKGLVTGDRMRVPTPDGGETWRSTIGYKTLGTSVRYWHVGLQAKSTTWPVLGYTMKPHVFFSDDGISLWESKERLHRARRSQCKNWWNDRWRDLIAGVVYWLGDSDGVIRLPVGPSEQVRVFCTPERFESAVSYDDSSLAPPDPEVVDLGEEDEEFGESEEDENTGGAASG
jgi:hypothetical protein